MKTYEELTKKEKEIYDAAKAAAEAATDADIDADIAALDAEAADADAWDIFSTIKKLLLED